MYPKSSTIHQNFQFLVIHIPLFIGRNKKVPWVWNSMCRSWLTPASWHGSFRSSYILAPASRVTGGKAQCTNYFMQDSCLNTWAPFSVDANEAHWLCLLQWNNNIHRERKTISQEVSSTENCISQNIYFTFLFCTFVHWAEATLEVSFSFYITPVEIHEIPVEIPVEIYEHIFTEQGFSNPLFEVHTHAQTVLNAEISRGKKNLQMIPKVIWLTRILSFFLCIFFSFGSTNNNKKSAAPA